MMMTLLSLFRQPPESRWVDLVEDVVSRSHARGSSLHGERHWRGVASAALTIADLYPQACPEICLVFALFHDSQRVDDGWDPEHGLRAARTLRKSRAARQLLGPERLEIAAEACEHHEKGRLARDPRIGACWDADRINLWRIGVTPNPRFFSLVSGQEFLNLRRLFETAWREPPDWPDLLDRMHRLVAERVPRPAEEDEAPAP